MFYFYLNNEKLKGMSARFSGKKITVNKIYDVDFPSEFLNDPTLANVDLQLTEAILKMIRKNNIKSKTVKFVLENSKIPFREATLPYGKPSVIIPIIQKELFNDKKVAEKHTVDYVELERNVNEKKQSKYMITYIDNLIIDNLKKCTRDVGMYLKSIDIAQSAISNLVFFMRQSLPKYFMLVDYRMTMVTSYLFANYKHVFSMSKPIYSMPNENFPNEMAFFINDFGTIVGESVTFFKTKYDGFNFDTIFITGDTPKLAPCEQQISDFLDFDIKIFPKPSNVTGVDLHEFNEFGSLIGSLVKAR